MRDLHSRSFMGVPCVKFFVSICCALLVIVLSSCSANIPAQRETQQGQEGELAVRYSVVCIIHGDGDYLYHDTSGTEYQADEEALAGVKKVVQNNPYAEVFVFHEQPRRHFLFLFPLHDGEFYYYRNGHLIAHESYRRNEDQSPFDSEVALYRRFRVDDQRDLLNVFLYCGHEIPEIGGTGYDKSYPDRTFTVHDLADALKSFTRHSGRFDLMVLSTCFGGTPFTIGTLGPYARYIIASPDNLHLSYFDLHSMERLDLGGRDEDVPAFAKRFAHQAFDRLTSNIQTAVSVAVYDVDRVQEYVRSVQKIYENTLTSVKGNAQSSAATVEHCDCADIPAYVLPTMSQGIDVFYRPARFGRTNRKQSHSGWECLKVREPHAAFSQTPDIAPK